MADNAAAVFDPSVSYSPLSVPASQTAVLLLDYQNFICGRIPNEEIRARVLGAAASVRAWANSQGIPVYHCLIDLSQEPVPTSKLAARWPMMKGMVQSNPGAGEIAASLTPNEAAAEKVTHRRLGFYSALSSPDLAEDLKANNIKSLIVCGISTGVVVLSTVRAANEMGYHVTVVKDACIDPSEELHQTLTSAVLPTSAHVASSEEIIEAWK